MFIEIVAHLSQVAGKRKTADLGQDILEAVQEQQQELGIGRDRAADVADGQDLGFPLRVCRQKVSNMSPSLGMPRRRVLAISSCPRFRGRRRRAWRLASLRAILRTSSCTRCR